jgi:hypothetical protein
MSISTILAKLPRRERDALDLESMNP